MNRAAYHSLQALEYPDPKKPLIIVPGRYRTWNQAVAQAVRWERESTEPYNRFYSKVEQLEGLTASEVSLYHSKIKNLESLEVRQN